MEGGEPKVIVNEEGSRLTPSVVAFTKDGEILVGQVAKRQAVTNPENTIFSIKRFMGRNYDEVTEEMKMVPYKVIKDEYGRAVVDVANMKKRYTPPEISAFILQKLKKAAEAYLGEPVTEAVITVPAYFNQRIIDWLIAEFKKDQGIDLSKDRMAIQRLKEAAEKAKIELSSTMETEINLPFITADATGPKHLVVRLSRAKLEQLTDDLVERSHKPCEQALKDAGIQSSAIDEVVLVGGMIRMPKIHGFVKGFFGREPHKGVNPDEVVAVGAAIQAGVLAGEVKEVVLLDVTPLSLGVETLGGVLTKLINRNTTIPTRKKETFTTAAD